MKKILTFVVIFLVSVGSVFAHQPRVEVEDEFIEVLDPEVSKAYYQELTGDPQLYLIESNEPFLLYASLSVPKSANPDGRYSLVVYEGDEKVEIMRSLADEVEWSENREPFAGDYYVQGPEIEKQVEGGKYYIEVYSDNNQGKYVLATGKIESFPWSEIVNSYKTIPTLKREFFEVSPATFAMSIFGGVYIVVSAIVGYLILVVGRLVMGNLKTMKKAKINLGGWDRGLRILIGVWLIYSGLNSWSFWSFTFGFFAIFEATSRWCIFNQIVGRDSCNI